MSGYLIKMLDYIVMQVVWFFYVMHNTWTLKKDNRAIKPDEKVDAVATQFQEDNYHNIDNNERHFIHLYTPNAYGAARPVCYMDVYKMHSPSDEQKLRDVCSKGIPNNTYLKYQQRKRKSPRTNNRHQRHHQHRHNGGYDFFEYSTIAL